MKYKFRAETLNDIIEWFGAGDHYPDFEKITITSQYIESHKIPDIEIEVEVENMILDELRESLKQVEQGHVMVQSVNNADEYTGERYYEED